MLRLPDAWTWDFWIADTGTEFHVFHLRASRALHDPDRRHRRASVGHAISTDLRSWRVVDDVLVAGAEPAWDDIATWTGSVLRDPDGLWRMFYTGLSRAEDGLVQRIGVATSTDLMTWDAQREPLCVADPRWYDTLGAVDGLGREFWRDPWVLPDPDGDGWHMLITARGTTGPRDQRGVVGHAWSPDLLTWTVRPPLSEPGTGFGQLEVLQVAEVDGVPVLLFSCLAEDMPAELAAGTTGGVWAVACDSVTGPFDIARAHLLLDDTFYSARLVQDRDGRWQALAFHNREPDGSFDGRLSDPMPVHWVSPGVLAVAPPTAGEPGRS